MSEVRHPPVAGKDPATEAHELLSLLRTLAHDAVAPRGERQHSRRYLRRVFKSHFRALAARIAALTPGAVAPEAPPPAG
jgi:hypothetical protein